jgi:rare lipoprotein A
MRGGGVGVSTAPERSALRPQARIGLALRLIGLTAFALGTANCSSQKVSSARGVDPKYGVVASPRVIADGDPVPKGGGREMVGRPYVVAGRTYVPRDGSGYVRDGLASWYGTAFHGRLTANGEIFDRESVAAAHPTLPLPSYTRITNLANGRSMIVRVNDRGPYHGNRLLDVSERVAEALDFRRVGTAKVRVEYVGRASTRGSDDAKLMATLRTDGRPAGMPGHGSIMFADLKTDPAPRAALAFRSSAEAPSEPLPQPAALQAAAAPAPVETRPIEPGEEAPAGAGAAPIRIADAPLPPERPFDLGRPRSVTLPVAAPPATRHGPVAQLPPQRPLASGLFFAEPERDRPARRLDAFAEMRPQKTVPFAARDVSIR